MADYTQHLAHRLRQLVEQDSLSRFARSIGAPPSSIVRYLQGRSIPASLLAKVCRTTGISPGWLLTGAEAPSLETATDRSRATSMRMLGPVQRMLELTRQRLDALSAPNPARMRERLLPLGRDTETVAQALSSEAAGVYDRLIEDYYRTLTGQFERAQASAMALEQLMPLVMDPRKRQAFWNLRATHLSVIGKDQQGLAMARRALDIANEKHAPNTKDQLSYRLNYVRELIAARHGHAALGLARASSIAAPISRETQAARADLRFLVAVLEFDMLKPASKVASDLRRCYLDFEPARKGNYRCLYLPALIHTGVITFQEVIAMDRRVYPDMDGELQEIYGRMLLLVAGQNEDAQDLVRGMEAYRLSELLARATLFRHHLVWVACLADELQGASGAGADRYLGSPELAAALTSERSAFMAMASACQLLRLARRKGAAMDILLRADDYLRSQPPGIVERLTWRTIHYRNALRLIAPDIGDLRLAPLRREAEVFADMLKARGYALSAR